MIAFLSAVSPTTGLVGAAAVYATLGIGTAAALRRRGVAPATVWSALLVWPLLWPLLSAGEDTRVDPAPGPMAARIATTFAAVERALAHPAAADVVWRQELTGLRRALEQADARLGLVEGLLQESTSSDPEVERSAAALRAARDHAAGELSAVLSGVERLRLQLGLLALAGDARGIGERLGELRARVAALDETCALARS